MRRMSALSWIGIAVSVLFVALALSKINFAEFGASMRNAHWGWVAPAMALYFVGHLFRGLRSRLILKPHTDISWIRAMNLILAGYAANNVLPARLGELIRTYVLSRLQGISTATALSTVFVERVFDGMAIVAILFAVTLFGVSGTTTIHLGQLDVSIAWIAWTAGAVFFGAFVCILGVALLQERFLALVERPLRVFPRAVGSKILQILGRLLRGMDFMRSGPLTLLLICGLSACVWLAEGAMFWMALVIFDLPARAAIGYLATCVTNLGIVIPASPGYAGTFHYFCAQSLQAFGIEVSTAYAYAVVVHAIHYIPVTFTGIWALHHYGFGLSRVADEVKPSDGPGTSSAFGGVGA
jgi:glycosyltransferase 2 family protein